jgi:uncharacterized protein YidB (DUF937 family)
MGFLDDVLGRVAGAEGGGGASPLAEGVLGLLSGAGSGGGLPELVRSFGEKGLGDIVASWVGTGSNLPVTPEQVREGLGSETVARLAEQAGLPADVATAKLADLLPTLVDRLTPGGTIPEGGLLAQGLALLKANLPKG